MNKLRIRTIPEQIAAYLREELARGRWQGTMPGRAELVRELGMSSISIEEALRILTKEGWLISQGAGRRRRIELSQDTFKTRALRVAILLGESSDRTAGYLIQLVHALQDAGHIAGFAGKTMARMGYKLAPIASFVKKSEVDAWVIVAGSREVLKWFAEGPLPAFALAGRASQLPMPIVAPDKLTPMRMAVRRLVELGHRRIVLMSRPLRRIPEPGLFERTFVQELEALGIATGRYNLPDWREGTEGYHAGLEALFRTTPPTAMFFDEAMFVVPTLQFCTSKGLHVPRDLSLISVDPDPAFIWSRPSIAHIRWDAQPLIRRIVRWAENVRRGKEDRRMTLTKAEFVEGGTVGPAPAV